MAESVSQNDSSSSQHNYYDSPSLSLGNYDMHVSQTNIIKNPVGQISVLDPPNPPTRLPTRLSYKNQPLVQPFLKWTEGYHYSKNFLQYFLCQCRKIQKLQQWQAIILQRIHDQILPSREFKIPKKQEGIIMDFCLNRKRDLRFFEKFYSEIKREVFNNFTQARLRRVQGHTPDQEITRSIHLDLAAEQREHLLFDIVEERLAKKRYQIQLVRRIRVFLNQLG